MAMADNLSLSSSKNDANEPTTNGILKSLNAFVEAYFRDASSESIKLAGGLNGHLALSRLLLIQQPLGKGLADVLVSMGALFHRLYYLRDILERYTATLEVSREEIPVLALIDQTTGGFPPLERASALYHAALAADSAHAQARFNQAAILALSDVTAAHAQYELAAHAEPSLSGHVALRRAALLEAAQNWSSAADLYIEAYRELKDLGPWHKNAARCLRFAERFEQSLFHYEHSLNWVRQPGAEFVVTPPLILSAKGADYALNPTVALQHLFTTN